MTFKLIGNELVGQPEKQAPVYNHPDPAFWDEVDLKKRKIWDEYLNSLPRYTVLPEDLSHFRSKEVWQSDEFELDLHEQKEPWKPTQIIARPLKTITPDSGKADAVGFAEWITKNDYISTTLKHEPVQYWHTVALTDDFNCVEGEEITTEQLYDIFINSK